jgi:4'-phosphopantetheinyl transferase
VLSVPTDIYPLVLQRTDRQFQACLAFTNASVETLTAVMDQYLHSTERAVYRDSLSTHQKDSFLRSRFIAKKALSVYLSEDALSTIQVKSGVFNQPLVVYTADSFPQISLSHTYIGAAGLAFSAEHPMGIDLEVIRHSNAEMMASQITSHETRLNQVIGEEENTFYTRLWTIKEAISKVLKTGLMTPFDVYELETIRKYEGYTESTFRNFSQYKAISFHWENQLCSIVLPKETRCILPDKLLMR